MAPRVVEYHDLAPGTEREIFQRVQLGMTLTAAGMLFLVKLIGAHTAPEKLQAISSPWAEWIADLHIRHVNSEDGLAKVLEWDTKRGRDFQCIAQMVYCCGSLPDQALPTAQKLERWLSRVDRPGDGFKSHIVDALNTFWHIASTPELNAAFHRVEKRVAPVEFVFIGTTIRILKSLICDVICRVQVLFFISYEITPMKSKPMQSFTCGYESENSSVMSATTEWSVKRYGVILIV